MNPCAPDEPQVRTGLVGGVLGMRVSTEEQPSAPPLEGAVLEEVRLVHTTLGQGGKSEGVARYRAPHAGGRLSLEARSPVPGHGWKFSLRDRRSNEASFTVGCHAERPRHTVRWTFALRDQQGNRSNEVTVPVECTGQPMPGAAPRLIDVALGSKDLPLAGRTTAMADLSVSHPPYEIIAAVTTRGNGWTTGNEKVWTDKSFSLGCDRSGGPHLIDLRFRVRDTFGRESNVVEKRLICGDCRPAR